MESKIINASSNDTWYSNQLGLPSALYFYYYGDDVVDMQNDNYSSVLGNCPSIQSIHYTPFLRIDDIDVLKIDYDVNRFGNNDKTRPSLSDTPPVFRIMNQSNFTKSLGSFKSYNITGTTIGGKWNWRNESRLYNYPFMYGMLSDNLNQPLEVIYHLCNSVNPTVKVRNTISDKCSYGIYIEGYKGDTYGRLEAMVSSDGHELPCSSSAYAQWYATSKNQTAQNIQNMAVNATLNNQNITQNAMLSGIGSVFNGISSASQGNIGGLLSSVTGIATTTINSEFNKKMNNLSVQQAISTNLAKQSDLKTTPPTMVSMGSNPYYGLIKGSQKLMLYRFGMRPWYYEKIGYYFHRFGYAFNNFLSPSRTALRNRYYFNYIKTTGAKISIASGFPRSIAETIESIYNNGVTIWHVDREGVTMHDYTMDNYEV